MLAAVTFESLVGRELGPCRLEELLGAGGMGAVYRARHLRLDREVAVKVSAPKDADPAADARFLREARLAAKLEDPRIVAVHDAGVDGPYRYIVMALVRGRTLEQTVAASGPLGQAEARRLMREVLLGLRVAHKAGVVHRDIKPGNVMVDADGAVRILDFGAAWGAGSGAGEACAEGTCEFMAPEQGFAASPDPRMDLYAWACTYFYALSGRPPFLGAREDVATQHRESRPPDIRELQREVSAPCAGLLLRCMEKASEKRPASADAVLAELDKTSFTLDLDASGSPFRILPAPVAPRVGFEPPPQAADEPARAPAVRMPDPPPPLEGAGAPSPAAWLIFIGLYAFFFGRPWARAIAADWTAGGVLSAGAAVVLALSPPGPRRRPAGALLLAAMTGLFIKAGGFWASTSAEVIVLGLLGLATAAAGGFLAFGDSAPDTRSGAALIALGCAALAAAAAAQRLPPAEPWASGIPAFLRAQWADWTATGGPWRWGGFVALYAASALRLSLLSDEPQNEARS